MLRVNVKKLHPEAVIPSYAKEGDAGLDLTAVSVKESDLYYEFDTGLAFEIPPGFFGMVVPRSSITKTRHLLRNSVGIIDSGYRDSVKVRLSKVPNTPPEYKVGDRIAQIIIMPYPQVELFQVGELTASERGVGGFGSSGA
jgi:dUTP pyrophosphatase